MTTTRRIVSVALIALLGLMPAHAALPILCPLADVCFPVMGDTDVRDHRRFNGGTYGSTGTIQVSDGGRLVLNDTRFVFGPHAGGILVHDGGELVIVNTDLVSSRAGFGPDVPIVAHPGSTITIFQSDLTGMRVDVRTDDNSIQDTAFSRAEGGLTFTDAEATVRGLFFRELVTAINITRGTVAIEESEFVDSRIGIFAVDTNVTLTDSLMTSMQNGALTYDSLGIFQNNAMSDNGHPPNQGLRFEDCEDGSAAEGNFLSDWGTAIAIAGCSPILSDNAFEGNIETIDYE